MFDLAKLRERRADDESGFTLIELLVVVVIIGILVAIAIPLYLNYKKGAADKSAESDLRGAISTLELCQTDNGSYPASVPSTSGPVCDDTQRITTSNGTVLTYIPNTVRGIEQGPDVLYGTDVMEGAAVLRAEKARIATEVPDAVRVPVPVPLATPTAYTLLAWNTNGTTSADKPYCYTSSVGGSIKLRTKPMEGFGAC